MTYEEPAPIDDDDTKVALYAKLASFGIASVEITYDGCDDSGCIESIQFIGPDNTEVSLPDSASETIIVTESVLNLKTTAYETVSRPCTVTLRKALADWCYDLLEEHFAGWEIDHGSSGTITLDITKRTGVLKNAARVIETVEHEVGV